MYRRFIDGRVKEALADTPVVLIVGPRRAGKPRSRGQLAVKTAPI
jgi:predicted AAA+ superfamily ATPase